MFFLKKKKKTFFLLSHRCPGKEGHSKEDLRHKRKKDKPHLIPVPILDSTGPGEHQLDKRKAAVGDENAEEGLEEGDLEDVDIEEVGDEIKATGI